MVSAVHHIAATTGRGSLPASKGLHMVSAVHLGEVEVRAIAPDELQRGCTWLVQFICGCPPLVLQSSCFKGAAHG